MSNFDYLRTRKTLRPYMLKRVTWLEHTVQQLKDYLKRCPVCKQNEVKSKIVTYETLADNLRIKFENQGV